MRASYHSIFTSFLVLIICVFVLLLSEMHFLRWDLTSYGEFTLSDKSINIVKQIDQPVKITAFVRKGFQEEEDAKKLLSSYHYYCGLVSYRLVDPERDPAIAKAYDVRDVNTFILEGYGRLQRVNIADEEHITNALVRLMQGQVRKVYWIAGHGERDFVGNNPTALSLLAETLKKQNYSFSSLNLMQSDIPSDAAVVIIAGPQKKFFPEEVESLQKFVFSGGRALIFLEPYQEAGLKSFLDKLGLRLYPDIVVDKLSRAMGGDYLLPLVSEYGDHEITHGFKLTSLFYTARTINPRSQVDKWIRVTPLCLTSEHAWAEMDRNSVLHGKARFNDGDRRGPLCLAAISELRVPLKSRPIQSGVQIKGKGQVAVFGDVDCASNRYFQLSGNSDLITNTIHYLAARGSLISIPKRHRPIEALMLSRRQGMIAFWIPVVVMPLIVLIIGIVVWLRRRSL